MKAVTNFLKNHWRNISVTLLIVVFLTISLSYSYLLFHIFVELLAVVVAFSLFIITYNSRKVIGNNYLLFIGYAMFFIGILDTLHTITYQNMNIISSPIFYANQFWIATRAFESLAILFGFLFIKKKKNINPDILLTILGIITLLIILSILRWEIFPICYIKGEGQTSFKIFAEYVIIAILFIALFFLIKYKQHFEKDIYQLLFASIGLTIISEFSFSLYISNFGISNQLGHYAKLLSFILIYKANIETGFKRPTRTIFKTLKESQENYLKLNEEYKIQNSELAKTIKKLADTNDELATTNNDLSEANATKDKFFSIIAHDLKNPFSTLMGMSEVLADDTFKLTPEKIKKFGESMFDASSRTYSMLENLLNWARAQTGKLTPEFTDIRANDIIEEIVEQKQDSAKQKKIKLIKNIESSDILSVDFDMIKTVLRNLVSNAIKFSYPGSEIIAGCKEKDNEIIFYVQDFGTGINEQDLEYLFRIDSKLSKMGTAKERGTGLGLILCKDFISLHNGEIWAESQKDKGSTFYFALPANN